MITARQSRSREDGLTVEAIFDLRGKSDSSPVHAATYLDGLSEAEWTDLRAFATRTGKLEQPFLRCGDCGKAVYARESWSGRRHFYHFKGNHADCRWSGAVAGNIRSIDAAKFQGKQEGAAHKELSQLVANTIALDRDTNESGISFRRYTKIGDKRYAYPDVYAERWQGGAAVFEIQLSTTHMPVIERRQSFYRDAAIRLVWIVGYHSENLSRRAFRDIYMQNDGQILGMDGEVAAVAREANEPRFRLYRLLPGSTQDGFFPRWRNKIVSPMEINWGKPGDRPRSAKRSYDSFLDERIAADSKLSALRADFYNALSRGHIEEVGAVWDKVVQIVGGIRWNLVPSPYDAVRAFGVLATLRTGVQYAPTRIGLEKRSHLVNSMLLEPPDRRRWTHAFELMCHAISLEDLLNTPSIHKKCERNKRELPLGAPIDRLAGPVFNVFFPEGAFYRLCLDDLVSD